MKRAPVEEYITVFRTLSLSAAATGLATGAAIKLNNNKIATNIPNVFFIHFGLLTFFLQYCMP
ncbi:hypothetical protein [Thermococcus sibiricus]|uniref:hypothetical protein n=1 Tax=Thermococcus sibiricus TaxID=172049 RepID=UPI001E3E2E1D|nr:hypothetical protein [Thermococcus sibiricus]